MQKQGVPPYWSSYIKHDDVDAVAVRATEAGGVVLFPPFDVMDAGRMTMIQDLAGALIGVWQPKQHIGAQLVNIPNTLVWNELQTPDLEGARNFYTAVFGWTYDVDPGGYVAVKESDRVQAGHDEIACGDERSPPELVPLHFGRRCGRLGRQGSGVGRQCYRAAHAGR